LKTLEWNNSHPISGDMPAAVKELKQQPGKNIIVSGSCMLVNGLLRAELVDELRLLVYPLMIGKGKRLFDAETTGRLRLVSNQTVSKGVIALVYVPQ
ncbi:dihydrofolate reductase, partial [bacterium]